MKKICTILIFYILFINISKAQNDTIYQTSTTCGSTDGCSFSIIDIDDKLNCIGEDSCYKSIINCNTNKTDCYIKCSGYTACAYTEINCNNDEYECNVNCSISDINDDDYGICAYATIS